MAKPIMRKWYDERGWAVAIGLLALGLAYAMVLRSLDTGSWQQYFLTAALLAIGINRLVRSVWPKRTVRV